MSNVSSHCRTSGTVRSMVSVATTLPSTVSVPVPARPIPVKLLKASVAKPRPSYLKSNTMLCLPGERNVKAFPAHPLEVKQVPNKDRFALQQVHSVAAKTSAVCLDHALRATLGYVDVGCDGVGGVEQVRRVPMRNSGYRL